MCKTRWLMPAALAWLPLAAAAQTQHPADPAALVAPLRHATLIQEGPAATPAQTTPDRAWKQLNQEVAQGGAHAGHATPGAAKPAHAHAMHEHKAHDAHHAHHADHAGHAKHRKTAGQGKPKAPAAASATATPHQH